MAKNKRLLIRQARIHTENGILHEASLLIQNGEIEQIYTKKETLPPMDADVEVLDGQQLNLIPGFIDGHIHGAAGADVMDATPEALEKMAAILPAEGTTSFLATTITQQPENIEQALKNVADYQIKPGEADLMGIHLEGPFIEKTKAGAQPPAYIIEPNIDQFKDWQQLSGNLIKTITLAPEHDHSGAFIRYLNESGLNVSAGHTDVDYEGMKKAVTEGVSQITHLCNAMNGIHHREIGLVGAAFKLKDIRSELIADGIHVVPDMMQIIYDNIGSDGLILITDSMRAKGLKPGRYELGGQPVNVTSDRANLETGSLAGSILKMHQGAQNMLKLDGVVLTDIVKMASVNPAKQLRVFDKKGSIEQGKDADILLVDDALNIKYTICRGVIAYEGE